MTAITYQLNPEPDHQLRWFGTHTIGDCSSRGSRVWLSPAAGLIVNSRSEPAGLALDFWQQTLAAKVLPYTIDTRNLHTVTLKDIIDGLTGKNREEIKLLSPNQFTDIFTGTNYHGLVPKNIDPACQRIKDLHSDWLNQPSDHHIHLDEALATFIFIRHSHADLVVKELQQALAYGVANNVVFDWI
jgi:hypothetical protein